MLTLLIKKAIEAILSSSSIEEVIKEIKRGLRGVFEMIVIFGFGNRI